jgi:cold shock CspA family protein
MRKEGKITFWNFRKGYGFIEPNGGGDQVFVHIRSFTDKEQRPKLEQMVSYEMSEDKRGRVCAANVAELIESVSWFAGKGKLLVAAVVVPIVVILAVLLIG